MPRNAEPLDEETLRAFSDMIDWVVFDDPSDGFVASLIFHHGSVETIDFLVPWSLPIAACSCEACRAA